MDPEVQYSHVNNTDSAWQKIPNISVGFTVTRKPSLNRASETICQRSNDQGIF